MSEFSVASATEALDPPWYATVAVWWEDPCFYADGDPDRLGLYPKLTVGVVTDQTHGCIWISHELHLREAPKAAGAAEGTTVIDKCLIRRLEVLLKPAERLGPWQKTEASDEDAAESPGTAPFSADPKRL